LAASAILRHSGRRTTRDLTDAQTIIATALPGVTRAFGAGRFAFALVADAVSNAISAVRTSSQTIFNADSWVALTELIAWAWVCGAACIGQLTPPVSGTDTIIIAVVVARTGISACANQSIGIVAVSSVQTFKFSRA